LTRLRNITIRALSIGSVTAESYSVHVDLPKADTSEVDALIAGAST